MVIKLRTTLIISFLIGLLGNILASSMWASFGQAKMTLLQSIIGWGVMLVAIASIIIAAIDLSKKN
jgi:hypothetical protein